MWSRSHLVLCLLSFFLDADANLDPSLQPSVGTSVDVLSSEEPSRRHAPRPGHLHPIRLLVDLVRLTTPPHRRHAKRCRHSVVTQDGVTTTVHAKCTDHRSRFTVSTCGCNFSHRCYRTLETFLPVDSGTITKKVTSHIHGTTAASAHTDAIAVL